MIEAKGGTAIAIVANITDQRERIFSRNVSAGATPVE